MRKFEINCSIEKTTPEDYSAVVRLVDDGMVRRQTVVTGSFGEALSSLQQNLEKIVLGLAANSAFDGLSLVGDEVER